ncbi:hypothetical protein EBZ80_24065 [bacterium]|nr:hypothetical protein [bacterium]
MGKSLMIDWKAVEKDYVSGKSRTFIASTYNLSYNTLDSRIRRFKWVARRNANADKIARITDEAVIQDQAGRQARYLSRITNQVEHSLDVLESSMPGTRKEVKEQVEVLEKLDKVARPALGLASQNQGSNGKTVVNLAVLRSDNVAGQVIDQ